jgi:hypothetical protein
VVGDPVQRGRRDDGVHGLLERELEHVLAPHLRAIAEPPTCQRDHLVGLVDREDAPPRHER